MHGNKNARKEELGRKESTGYLKLELATKVGETFLRLQQHGHYSEKGKYYRMRGRH